MCELFYIGFLILSDLEPVCYSRIGSHELTKWRDSRTGAAGHENRCVSRVRLYMYVSDVPCRFGANRWAGLDWACLCFNC